MAIPADTIFEVQPGVGSDTQCGGGFSAANKGATGVDYSTNGTAKYTYTSDLSGSGTTTLTSAGGNFTNDILGNLIQISGQGTYCVTAFSSSTSVTVDRSLGTFSSTTGYLGGSFNSPGMVGSLMVSGSGSSVNGCYIKNTGTAATMTASSNVSGGRVTINAAGLSAAALYFVGYTSNRTPNNTDSKPSINVAANSVTCFDMNNNFQLLRNISFTNTGAHTGCTAWLFDSGSGIVEDCNVTSYANGSNSASSTNLVSNCYFSGCTTPISAANQNQTTIGCVVSGGGNNTTAAISDGRIERCIVSGFNGTGIALATGNCSASHCVVDGCTGTTGNGFSVASAGSDQMIVNCISSNNSAHGYVCTGSGTVQSRIYDSAGYNNTSGNFDSNYSGAPAYVVRNFITLTASPYTNPSGGDFSLNTSAGGGASLRAAGYPSAYPGISTTSYPDIGAVQHPDPVAATYVINKTANNFYYGDPEP